MYQERIVLHGKEFQLKQNNALFSFECEKCAKCCSDTDIQLFPFDIFRLCRGLGITTTELHQKYTRFVRSATNAPLCYLKTSPICSFNKDNTCSIYEHRPLLCRLFPVGFTHLKDGFVLNERFCMGIGKGNHYSIGEWNIEAGIDQLNLFLEGLKKISYEKLKQAKIRDEKEFDMLYKIIFYDFDSRTAESLREKLKEQKPQSFEEQLSLIIKSADVFLTH